jgi:hypothetical protein
VDGIVGEITLERHRDVALRVGGALRRLAQQPLERAGVAEPLVGPDHGQGQDLLVAPERRGGVVPRSVVQHQDLVVARQLPHDPADLPEQDADGARFVVDRDADVDQRGCLQETNRRGSRGALRVQKAVRAAA